MDTYNTPQSIIDLRKLPIVQKKRKWKFFMEKYNCQTITEIGVFRGENFQLMIEHNPKEAIAVDHWNNDGIPARMDSGYSKEILEEMYQNFKKSVIDKPFVRICREYTFDAVEHFSDEHFDLIYIDADHSYEGCLRDIVDWYPKIKKGGFIIGDDYRHYKTKYTGVVFKVIEAVNDFAKKYNLQVYELPRYGWAIIKPL